MNKQTPLIRLSEETKQELDKIGTFKESYEDVVKRLLEIYKEAIKQ